jgi:hypothetical protein
MCPACGYNGLAEAPWVEDMPSDEICPSCGIQFGYDDAAGGDIERRSRIYADWRARWRSAGCPWSSQGHQPPPDWDPEEQLRRVPAR